MRTMPKIEIIIRSCIFWVFSTAAIVLYSLIVVLSRLLPISYQKRHALIRIFLRHYINTLKMICHIDYVVEGLEHIPKNKFGVILSKHQSAWETFFLPTIFHDPAVIVKRELLWVPFFGWGLAAIDPIAINRANKSTAMQQIIEKGKKCIAAGRWILVFPEGTRVPVGQIGHYKLGGARLAVAAGCPIVPVAHNAGRFWPRRRFLKWPGTIHVVIGQAIETQGRSPEEVLVEAKTWIEDTVLRIDGTFSKSTR